jgi:uncharacterized protein involved in outer membrane biogenesis
MGKLVKVIVILAVIVGVLFVGKNSIVKVAVEKVVQAATGLPLEIKKLDIGIVSTHIGITDLSLFNPSGFPKGVMFHAPEIFVDYHLGDLLKGKVHLEDLRLNFDEFVIVKNAEGLTNLEALKPKAKDEPKATAKGVEKEGKKMEAPEIQIDHLVLKVGKLIYKDYSGGGEPSIKEINVNISEEMTNVTNVQTLLSFVAAKAIAKSGLNFAFDFTTDILQNPAGAPKQVIDTLKGTTDLLKDKIKLPFGNN